MTIDHEIRGLLLKIESEPQKREWKFIYGSLLKALEISKELKKVDLKSKIEADGKNFILKVYE